MTAALSAKAKLEHQLEILEQSPGSVDARALSAALEDAVADLDGGPSDQADEADGGNLRGAAAKLFDLASFIKMARCEIAEIRPQDISEKHVQTATDELDAIVESTEFATNNIFEAVEAIEALTESMDPALAEKVTGHVTEVYEACSFQDITGQRITKVVKALKLIEEKVDALVDLVGAERDAGFADRQAARAASEAQSSKRPDEHLLNGPQFEQDAVDQSDVDALLNFD